MKEVGLDKFLKRSPVKGPSSTPGGGGEGRIFHQLGTATGKVGGERLVKVLGCWALEGMRSLMFGGSNMLCWRAIALCLWAFNWSVWEGIMD